jgi:DNA-binding MarR family transcriptional regulator
MTDQAGRHPWRRIPADGHTLAPPDFLTSKINTLARLLKRSSTKAYIETFDIAVTEWRMLAAIVQQQPCGVGELALNLDSDKALTGRTLKRLEQRKLISIDAHPTDGRALVVKTTSAGEAMYRKILPFAQARQAALLRQLSEAEREELWSVLGRLIEHVTLSLEPEESSEIAS